MSFDWLFLGFFPKQFHFLWNFFHSLPVIKCKYQINSLTFFKHNWRLCEYPQATLTYFYPDTLALHSNGNENLPPASTVLCQISIKQTTWTDILKIEYNLVFAKKE